MRRSIAVLGVLLVCWLAGPRVRADGKRALLLRHVTLDLPGPPSKVMPVDVNDDGRNDLVVVTVYTEIEPIGEDRVENLVQFTTVIPALFNRREVRVYLADGSGGFAPAGEPLDLPESVLHMEPGPAGAKLIALTDTGLERVAFGDEGRSMRLEPLIEDVPVLAGTESFYAGLELVRDLDGDGVGDVLLPGRDALGVYLADGSGLRRAPSDRIPVPDTEILEGSFARRWYPWPEVVEVDGDGRPDLVFPGGYVEEHPAPQHVLLGTGRGEFDPLREIAADCHDRGTDLRIEAEPGAWPWPRDLAELRDIDGDGRAEAVLQRERPRGDGFRKEMKDAKRPIHEWSFHELNDGLEIAAAPYFTMEAEGHSWDSGPDEEIPFRSRQFQDLDADGRLDLVTLTLDFSVFQALRVLATKRISIGLDFHVFAQQADGTFREVPGLDLSEKLKLDLNNLKLGRFAQFAGDFDGDGRRDFVHLGRGKRVTIHAGRPGCRYPKEPDLSVELEEEPASLDLVRIEDLDGDGRSDIRITRPLERTDPDVSAPVRLDLYLSGEVR